MSEQYDLVIVSPVFNDWGSLSILLQKIAGLKQLEAKQILVTAINDGSTEAATLQLSGDIGFDVELVHLQRNVGHQKAIAIGLSYVTLEKKYGHAVVMDADGEDNPEDIITLWHAAEKKGDTVVFAQRKKRQEGLWFRAFYGLYKKLFKLLTGVSISFGNFSALSYGLASRLIYASEIWNHYAGGVIRVKLPYALIPIERGKRISGQSKMNLQSLILHGLSSLSVHIEPVSVRLLLASLILLILSVILILVVFGIKIFTTLAIPGWTSNVIIGLTLIFLQALFLSVMLVFIILSYRTQKNFIPALDYKAYVNHIEKLK